jgi:hypothetical protein
MYIEKTPMIVEDTSYESLTQNLTQQGTTNIDMSNIWGVLLDNALDLIGTQLDNNIDFTFDATSENTPVYCETGYDLVDGKCVKKEDKTKKYVMYGIIAVIVISIGYVLYKKYGK